MAEAEQMYPEQIWDACEELDRRIDAQAHDRVCKVPKTRPNR